MRRRFATASAVLLPVLAIAPGLAIPTALPAQTTCNLVASDSIRAITVFTGTRLIYASQPDVECDDGTRMQADSAEVNEAAGISRFFGNVRFRDPSRSLTSSFAEFYDRQDRLLAWENVVLSQTHEGSVIRGDTLEYYRASEFIPEDLLTMRGRRVRSTLPPRGGEGSPYAVESDRMVIQGESRITATGMVTVQRDSLRAWGDTMTFDPDTDRLRLAGLARIEGRNYELRARIIDLLVPGDTLREALALRDPELTTEGMHLTASREIRIEMDGGEPHRLVALVERPDTLTLATRLEGDRPLPARPRAEAEEFVLEGDSLDVRIPGGGLESVTAVGHARGISLRDTDTEAEREERDALPEPLRQDWMEGDTIVAMFVANESAREAASPPDTLLPDPDPSPDVPEGIETSPDSARSRYQLDRLTASGNARSLYHLAPSDSAAAEGGGRALHYVVGRRIVITMRDGEADRMEVEEPRGVHLEPVGRRAEAPGTEPVPPDSVSGSGVPDPARSP